MDVRLFNSTSVGDREKNVILVGETRGLEGCGVKRVEMEKLDPKKKNGVRGLTQMVGRGAGDGEKLGLDKGVVEVWERWRGRMTVQ